MRCKQTDWNLVDCSRMRYGDIAPGQAGRSWEELATFLPMCISTETTAPPNFGWRLSPWRGARAFRRMRSGGSGVLTVRLKSI